MAKGVPLMGRDPDGKAKIINVDENGNVKVQQSGYRSFDFDGSPTVTVAPESFVGETEAWHVNGFSTLGYFVRSTDNVKHRWYLVAYMAATAYQTTVAANRVQVILADRREVSESEAHGTTETFTQWTRCVIVNQDSQEHTYRIHFLLRAG